MNTLQMIWSALTMENEELFKFISIPLAYLDAYIGLIFFTTILNIKANTKNKILYVVIYGTISNLITFSIPTSYKIFINMAIWPILVFLILKATILKSILSEVMTLITTSILESLFASIYYFCFGITSQDILVVPFYRLTIAIFIYTFIYFFTILIKYFKLNIEIFDNLNKKTLILLILNTVLILLVLALQFYLIVFYNSIMPLYITIFNIIALLAYFGISIYSILKSSKLAITQRNLENANNTIQSLTILHDQVRSFKHDFDNIVNSIGGYVVNEDLEGLKKYYNELLEECHKTNNLYALSPQVINHPAIYHMLATKYYEADQIDIQINLNVFLDLNEIEKKMKIYDFTRILGILLDNAIDAAKECDKKIMNVIFRKEISNNEILVIIQNTYKNKDVDTEEIYQKGLSSKQNHSGLGLWKVRQILKHNNNLNLYTTKNDEFFTQQFEIYD